MHIDHLNKRRARLNCDTSREASTTEWRSSGFEQWIYATACTTQLHMLASSSHSIYLMTITTGQLDSFCRWTNTRLYPPVWPCHCYFLSVTDDFCFSSYEQRALKINMASAAATTTTTITTTATTSTTTTTATTTLLLLSSFCLTSVFSRHHTPG